MNKHRTQEEIIADILSIVSNQPKKTHIMYGANLSYSLLCKYLEKLMEARLICYQEAERVYVLTRRGRAYLEYYNEYKELEDALLANESAFHKKRDTLSALIDAYVEG